MFSDALKILDENTVRYMIDEICLLYTSEAADE